MVSRLWLLTGVVVVIGIRRNWMRWMRMMLRLDHLEIWNQARLRTVGGDNRAPFVFRCIFSVFLACTSSSSLSHVKMGFCIITLHYKLHGIFYVCRLLQPPLFPFSRYPHRLYGFQAGCISASSSSFLARVPVQWTNQSIHHSVHYQSSVLNHCPRLTARRASSPPNLIINE